MSAPAAERYASAIAAARAMHHDFVLAAAIAARENEENELGLIAVRYLAGDRHGTDVLVEHLVDRLMRAGFKKRLRPLKRCEAQVLACSALMAWASGDQASFFLFTANGRLPHVMFLLARIERVVQGFDRELSRLMGEATA